MIFNYRFNIVDEKEEIKMVKEAMDSPLINQFLFYPRRIARAEIPDVPYGSLHIFESGGGEKISAYLYEPFPNKPIVLLFHGNGEVITDYFDFLMLDLKAHELNFCVVDYRGYGLSEGEPCLSAILEDGRAVWKYMTENLKIPPQRFVIFGRSMGSIPALELASVLKNSFAGLVIESGIAAFDKWVDSMSFLIRRLGMDIDELRASLRKNLDHQRKIEMCERPILIMHTENDEIVPSFHARLLYEWAGSDKANLKIFPYGGHNTIFFYNREEYMKLLTSFIAKVT